LGAVKLEKRIFCLLFGAPAKKSAAVKAEHDVRITNALKRECAHNSSTKTIPHPTKKTALRAAIRIGFEGSPLEATPA
jgi:hypothetical protein